MRTRSPLDRPRLARRPSAILAAVALSSLAVLASAPPAEAAGKATGKIEAVRGKKYGLTKQHGPWMIMVASFNPLPVEERTDGMTPEQAADELVFELRSKGLPAYAYAVDTEVEKVSTLDRLGEPDTRMYAARRGGVCVLAGNYSDPSDPVAKKSLDWVKKFRPKFLSGGQADKFGLVSLPNGGVFRVSQKQAQKDRGPFAQAFLAVNPMLTPEEARGRRVDPLLVRINAGGDCSLFENKGNYTLVVASFYGNSVTQVSGRKPVGHMELTDTLDHAAHDAWQLARALRTEMKVDAYVWHDRHKSVVAVGTFEDKTDPRIPDAIKTYGAKMREDQTGKPVLTAEAMTVPLRPTPENPIRQKWVFDPEPALMAVPKF